MEENKDIHIEGRNVNQMEGEKKMEINRRGFLKGAAFAGVAAMAPGVIGNNSIVDKLEDIVWDREVDLLVVGSGGAAMVCACVAIDAGLDVLVVDKNTHFGGCTNIALGSIGWRGPINGDNAWATYTPQVAYDILTDQNERENKKNDPAVTWAYVNNTAATHDFLVSHGVQLIEGSNEQLPPVSYPRDYEARPQPGAFSGVEPDYRSGSGVVQGLADAFWAKGGEILENHELIELIRDESGKVIGGVIQITESTDYGVKAKDGEPKLFFKANTAVMLGSGSWKGNLQLRKLFDPRIPDYLRHTGQPYVHNTGTAIVAAMNIGAAICSDQQVDVSLYRNKWGTPWYNYRPNSGVAAPGLSVNTNNSQHYILINKAGNRYVDDSLPQNGYIMFDRSCKQEDLLVWMIFDEAGRDAQDHDVTPPNCDPDYAFSADTISELAGKINVPASA